MAHPDSFPGRHPDCRYLTDVQMAYVSRLAARAARDGGVVDAAFTILSYGLPIGTVRYIALRDLGPDALVAIDDAIDCFGGL